MDEQLSAWIEHRVLSVLSRPHRSAQAAVFELSQLIDEVQPTLYVVEPRALEGDREIRAWDSTHREADAALERRSTAARIARERAELQLQVRERSRSRD